MQICGHILFLQAIVQCRVDLFEIKLGETKKVISEVLLDLTHRLKWENNNYYIYGRDQMRPNTTVNV